MQVLKAVGIVVVQGVTVLGMFPLVVVLDALVSVCPERWVRQGEEEMR